MSEPTIIEQITVKIVSISDKARQIRTFLKLFVAGEATVCGLTFTLTTAMKNQLKQSAKTLCQDITTLASEIDGLIP